jgi:hypothetical protein
MQLWEGLSQDLNYNTMFSQRGVMNVGHSLQDMRDIDRRVNANRLNGVDGVVLSPQQIKAMVPFMNTSASLRYPVMGASFQPRAGVARHDAIAWGFARAADALGVDILQNCEVIGIRRDGDQVTGIETTRGHIASEEDRHRRGRPQHGAGRHGRHPPAAGEPPAAGAGLGAAQADLAHGGDVQRDPRLHQPVRQGRPGDRRRHRQLHWATASAAASR